MSSGAEPKAEETAKQTETWKGSCHCGAVKFAIQVPGSLYDEDVLSCNCSICLRNGYLFTYRLNTQVSWESGKDSLTTYLFAGKRLGHRFCPVCGVSLVAISEIEGFYDEYTAVNVRALHDVDVKKLKVKEVDGKNMTEYK